MNTPTATADYHCMITANTSPKEAFDKIARVPEWWATDFEGSARKLNDIFTVRFGTTWVTFKITEAAPDNTITWYVLDCNIPSLAEKKEWKDTSIIWEILARTNATQIDMTHAGLTPEAECFEMCQKGWNHFIKVSLEKFLNEGEGLPEGPGRPRASR